MDWRGVVGRDLDLDLERERDILARDMEMRSWNLLRAEENLVGRSISGEDG